MLQEITNWLAATPVSETIQEILWIIPMIQSVHILAIAIVLSSVGMIDLRIFGLAGGRSTLQETAQRYVPWIWGALVVLALTGSILVIGEPGRSLVNPMFQIKMALLVCAIAVTTLFQVTVSHRAALLEIDGRTPGTLKVFAVLTLLLWFAIAVAGRWIAYISLGTSL